VFGALAGHRVLPPAGLAFHPHWNYFSRMGSIILKGIPDALHAQLEQEASANFRSLDQEALARIEMSFQIQEAFNTKRVQNWIDEALTSGPEEPLSREKFDAAFQRAVNSPLKK
jgi:hypothetical protein